jgi:hypothetical protein
MTGLTAYLHFMYSALTFFGYLLTGFILAVAGFNQVIKLLEVLDKRHETNRGFDWMDLLFLFWLVMLFSGLATMFYAFYNLL